MSQARPPAAGSDVRSRPATSITSPEDRADAADRDPGPNRARIALLLIAALVATAAVIWYQTRPTLPEGVPAEEYERAARQFRQRYGRSPERVDVLSLLGEQYVAAGRPEHAALCFAQIPNSHPRYGASSRLQAAQVFVRLNRVADAEHLRPEVVERRLARREGVRLHREPTDDDTGRHAHTRLTPSTGRRRRRSADR